MMYGFEGKKGNRPSASCAISNCPRKEPIVNEMRYICPHCYAELEEKYKKSLAESEEQKKIISNVFKEIGHTQECKAVKTGNFSFDCDCGHNKYLGL